MDDLLKFDYKKNISSDSDIKTKMMDDEHPRYQFRHSSLSSGSNITVKIYCFDYDELQKWMPFISWVS